MGTVAAAVHQPDFDEICEAAFPPPRCACDFNDLAAFRALNHAHERPDELLFAAGKAAPPLFGIQIICFHGAKYTEGGGTFMGPYPKIFSKSYSQ